MAKVISIIEEKKSLRLLLRLNIRTILRGDGRGELTNNWANTLEGRKKPFQENKIKGHGYNLVIKIVREMPLPELRCKQDYTPS